tara:strand:- start:847 stop:1248 length:402 start_codon:yes stop_codon:yes gene_type:complete
MTVKRKVMITNITEKKSAFGMLIGNPRKDEVVYFTNQLVNKYRIEIGMRVFCTMIPNYEDRQDGCPWRAVEVDCFQPLLNKVNVRQGVVWKHLTPEVADWLIDEAIKMKQPDIGVVAASIITDVYHDEMEGNE